MVSSCQRWATLSIQKERVAFFFEQWRKRFLLYFHAKDQVTTAKKIAKNGKFCLLLSSSVFAYHWRILSNGFGLFYLCSTTKIIWASFASERISRNQTSGFFWTCLTMSPFAAMNKVNENRLWKWFYYITCFLTFRCNLFSKYRKTIWTKIWLSAFGSW